MAPAEKLIEHALGLIVQSEVSPPRAARNALARLQQWVSASPEHAAAASEARRRWQMLDGMSEDLRGHFDAPAAASPGRRNLLLSIAAAVGTATLAGRLGWQYSHAPVFTAGYRTRPAEMLDLRLPDAQPGSQLALGGETEIGVTLYRQRRVVRLDGGELRCDVAHDSARPFQVMTRDARIEVVGTVFNLRDRAGALSVGVERGQVRVALRDQRPGAAADAYGAPIDLLAGEVLDVRDGAALPARRGDASALAAWREGWLVFQDTPLREALATVNAYRPVPIVSTDPRVDALRLSGRFPLRDSAGLLATLPQVLPLRVRTRSDGSAELSLR